MPGAGIRGRKPDIIFTAVVLCAVVLLSAVPTGFEELIDQSAERVRARVTATDNSQVKQMGIVKAGTQLVTVELLAGSFKGRKVQGTNELVGSMELDTMFAPGELALVSLDLSRSGEDIAAVNLIDHYRIHVELLLFLLFFALLLVYAGWTGLRAFLSFVFTAVLIWKVLLPGFLRGYDPILLSLLVVGLLSAVIILLIGGVSKKGGVAFLGAICGVGATALFSLLFGRAFHIHGAVKQFSETLLYSGFPHLDITRIFLAGIFIASSGAVMDIAMDIAASMHEVKQNHPQIGTWKLIMSGLSVGRAVVGTMTTTLLLAYSGGYTAMLMVFMAQGTPLINVANITYVSAEILHTMVGSFGLVLVAPITAFVGGAVFSHSRTAELPAVSTAAGHSGNGGETGTEDQCAHGDGPIQIV